MTRLANQKKRTRAQSAILIRNAAMAARNAANEAAGAASFVVNLLEHEPATRDLVLAVKALRGIANAGDQFEATGGVMRGLARRALDDLGLTWGSVEALPASTDAAEPDSDIVERCAMIADNEARICAKFAADTRVGWRRAQHEVGQSLATQIASQIRDLKGAVRT